MIELYFLLYRIPKIMSGLARERHRSALAWSLIGVGSWVGAEFFIMFSFGVVYGLGTVLWGWSEEEPAGLMLLLYVIALAAAVGGFSLARHILSSMPRQGETASSPQPPPPPTF
ncbi:MAG: hypothetical protein WCF57_07030 [Pyrinomonadaceae bacterium]